MSHELYKVLHILGLLCVFSTLAAYMGMSLIPASSGGFKSLPASARKALASLHGLGLVLLLISGFGMLARLNLMSPFPIWAMVKLVIWLIFGASTALAKRKANWGLSLGIAWIGLGVFAASLAIFKPF